MTDATQFPYCVTRGTVVVAMVNNQVNANRVAAALTEVTGRVHLVYRTDAISK